MKTGSGLLHVFDGIIDRLLCVAGAVLLSQGPEFMQQYLQRLGGHLAESRRTLHSFQEAADRSGVPFDRFVTQTSASADAGISHLGTVMSSTAERAAKLQAAHDALINAHAWSRPFAFLRHLDHQIAHDTWSLYRPAMPVTAEGLIYALTGMLIFLAIYHLGVKQSIAFFTRKGAAAPAS